MDPHVVQGYVDQLTELARQLNTFASGLKTVRVDQKSKSTTVREDQAEYLTTSPEEISIPLFSEDDLHWLQS
jgi:CRP-like cAMP-binding protein